MKPQELHSKYRELSDTLFKSDSELERDFVSARDLVATDPNSGAMVALSVVRDWIALERRLRIPGLGRTLAR